MKRRWLVGVAVVLALWFLIWPKRPSAAPAPRTPAAVPKPVRPHDQPVARPREAPDPPPTPEPLRPLPVRALEAIAEQAGEGVVDCVLPPGTPEDLRVPLPHERHGNVLTLRVPNPRGRALVRPPILAFQKVFTDEAEKRAWSEAYQASTTATECVLWWSEAYPGARGHCEVGPVDTVRIAGRVESVVEPSYEGAVEIVSVHGCGRDFEVAPDGTFSGEIPVQEPCRLEYASRGMNVGTVIDPIDAPQDIVVALGSKTMVERMQERIDELDWLLASPDPVERAAEAERDPELREVLVQQAYDLRSQREGSLRDFEDARTMFGASETQEDEVEAP